jgi:hypothetical protein
MGSTTNGSARSPTTNSASSGCDGIASTSLREIAASRVRYTRAVKKLVEDYITESKALVDAQDG